MMGSSQGHLADWYVLAKYRQHTQFILIPDNDEAGKKYIGVVAKEIQKACPKAELLVCELPSNRKGEDFIDWIKSTHTCLKEWDEFDPISETYKKALKANFEDYVEKNQISIEDFLSQKDLKPDFLLDPLSIEEVLLPVLSCPIQTFPRVVIDWIESLADQMQIPTDYLAAPFIVYVGSLIGRKRCLKLRKGTDWIEFSNLWGMLVGRPSVMKSPAMKAVRKPLLLLVENASKLYEQATKQFEQDQEVWKLKKKVSEENFKKQFKIVLAKPSSSSPILNVEGPPNQPKKKRYKSEDPTVEKLGELLIENPQGLLLFRDEIAGWLNSFEKTGRENDRQFFLESWSGKEEFEVDRISRGSLRIPALCLSIFGSIQPGPLSQYVRSAIKGGYGDDGFIQRFQVIVWPDTKDHWELIENCQMEQIEEDVNQIFYFLDQLAFDQQDKPVILHFDTLAQKAFNEWQKEFENFLRKDLLPSYLESHFAKYKKLLPALCLVLEHLRHAINKECPIEVSEDTLTDALLWIDYFGSHAKRLYGSITNAIPKAAKELIQKIKNGIIQEPFSVRDIYHGHHWSGLANSQDVEEVLEYLIEKNYLIGTLSKTTGRPSYKYWVNPKIFEIV